MLTKEALWNLLRADVVPALGCTEPVCVALCSAYAGKALHIQENVNELWQRTSSSSCSDAEPFPKIESIEITTNAGIYKNGMSAGIPNCNKVGLPIAAAIGACLKNPEKQLQLLEDLTPELLEQASRLVTSGSVCVVMDPEIQNMFVKCILKTTKDTVICVIQNAHTEMVYLEKNGVVLFEKESSSSGDGESEVIRQLQQMRISEIRELVDTMTAEDLSFMMDGVRMNEELASYSETEKAGVGLADAFRQECAPAAENAPVYLLTNGLLGRIITTVTSAAESRLDGCPKPTMSSSGAGTKGLAVILPVSETAKALHAPEEKTVRALALAHLVNRYINAYIGKLSPMCSCVAAASTAASAGIAYLLDGTNEQIGYAIRNMAGSVTGMICDGGKVGCALKVSTGSAAAVMSAVAAVHSAALRASDGICAETPEDCIRNMARIGIYGMSQTDKEILSIMTGKNT